MMSFIIKGAEDASIRNDLELLERQTEEFRRISAELATIRALKRHREHPEPSSGSNVTA